MSPANQILDTLGIMHRQNSQRGLQKTEKGDTLEEQRIFDLLAIWGIAF